MASRIQSGILSLLVALLLGFTLTTVATAAPGPFWHHRKTTAEMEGFKIPATAPENFKGTGGEQTIKDIISGTSVTITAPSVQVKGAIFNNASQGQIKEELIYTQPKLIEPVLSGCTITIGTRNIAMVKGHLMWKWDQTRTQLERLTQSLFQTSDIAFTGIEPPQQTSSEAIKLVGGAGGTIMTITLLGPSCGVFAGTFIVEGGYVGIPSLGIGTFTKQLPVRTIGSENGNFFQHYPVGATNQGLELGLTFGSAVKNPATLVGQVEVEMAQQEVAIFEE
jgi:hypothetical protein